MNNRNAGRYARGETAVRRRPNRKRAVLVCTILAAVFVIAMAVVFMSVSDNRSYNDYMNQAQQLFYNKDYDGNDHTLNSLLPAYSWVIYNAHNTTYDSSFPNNTTAAGLGSTDAILYKSSVLTLSTQSIHI